MDFLEFKRQVKNQPLIFSQDVVRGLKDPQPMRNQLTRWHKKGLLIPLRKGLYILNSDNRNIEVDHAVIANTLYQPSYISLEYALNFYGFIPESVSDITSMSTRKTAKFINDFGTFRYQHVNPEAFRGFKKVGEGQNTFFMAEVEKAVVDFLYLNLSQFDDNVKEILEQSYRFQNMETLHSKRLLELALVFNNEKLNRVIKKLVAWIREKKRD